MFAMTFFSRLVGGWPLHVFLVWLNFAKFSKLSSLCVTFILLVGYPSHQITCGKPKVLLPNLVVAAALALWPGLLIFHSAPM